MDRRDEAKECKMIHDIAHHTDDVGDENNRQSNRNTFCVAAEQSGDQNTDGNVDKPNNNLADKYADHIDEYTGYAHFAVEEPNDKASYHKEYQAVNEITDKSANDFLAKNAASGNGKTIEEFNGPMTFFIGQCAGTHDAGINAGEEQDELEKICRKVIRMA